jgi:hypothetical protein
MLPLPPSDDAILARRSPGSTLVVKPESKMTGKVVLLKPVGFPDPDNPIVDKSTR